ncbi:helix-turn-helix transcriptional regulator [Curtobacterium sp. MCPF17_002]|uniref:helix-turn-helix transcriptional regulator n=1 Tax=Curtobacterium sp. MCPF17_002 TaxID=2175645 RepID=UPI001C649895|nr:helix-turn-helix transcriptional regulator [Curtobacterium sp. MCPF17_002]WIB77974.1 helix-turn-helix transcriptional regulator [Curtobacterium sp. MCPF17_002]
MQDPEDQQNAGALFSAFGHDTGDAVRTLGPLYAGSDWYCRPLDDRFTYKYVAVGDEQLSVRRFQMHGYLSGTAATGSDIVVQWLQRGTGRIGDGRDEVPLQPGAAPTLCPVGRRFRIEYEDPDQRLVHIHEDLLLDVAAEQSGSEPSLTFDVQAPPELSAIGRWHSSLSRALEAFRIGGSSSQSWHDAQRDAARAFLGMYPLRGGTLNGETDLARNSRVRLATAFLHDHAHEPLSVGDIADAAGLSVRGLQETFQRELGESPMTYLRDTRLDRVHHELQAAEPGTVSVADVARRWGFGHVGRFSGAYTERFGEYPRHTLRTPPT